ncbi:putative thioredoxin [Nemania sp. FL0916]|nr:putative thioredoxin [Nemania sp. FL0916]
MTNFIIEIVSDPVCPWCYIGKKRLDTAISLYLKTYPSARANDTFAIHWRAFYLDPEAPKEGISWDARCRQRLIAKHPQLQSQSEGILDEQVAALRANLASRGLQDGISFSFAGKIGSTRSAHRAIALSRRLSLSSLPDSHSSSSSESHNHSGSRHHSTAQDIYVTALFAAYFENDLDITSHTDLAAVATSSGLDGAQLLAWLDAGECGEEVDAEDREARARGLVGVPHFTVLGHEIDGAKDVREFFELFVKIKEEEDEGWVQGG